MILELTLIQVKRVGLQFFKSVLKQQSGPQMIIEISFTSHLLTQGDSKLLALTQTSSERLYFKS